MNSLVNKYKTKGFRSILYLANHISLKMVLLYNIDEYRRFHREALTTTLMYSERSFQDRLIMSLPPTFAHNNKLKHTKP